MGPNELTSVPDSLESPSPSPRTKEAGVLEGRTAATAGRAEEEAVAMLSSATVVIEAEGTGVTEYSIAAGG
jgi:hypothetical protein